MQKGVQVKGVGASKKALVIKNNFSLKKCVVLISVHMMLSTDYIK